LKRVDVRELVAADVIASRAEAWIETDDVTLETTEGPIASRAEAWIETRRCTADAGVPGIASRAEAWIETRKNADDERSDGSPPARRRGLKLHKSGCQLQSPHRLPRGGVD